MYNTGYNAGASAAVAGGGAYNATIQAIRAMGAIVRVEPHDFVNIISKNENPLSSLNHPRR
ncbi:MAG: hypothetical protein CVT48_03365 [Thermoplasmata archaeon HGW-Thermoplasmata-1]|nr:MAG: hypothetical protein CVT48_03365 [Thermoplasmata archaeon HGW-Thermoplasmata-1]